MVRVVLILTTINDPNNDVLKVELRLFLSISRRHRMGVMMMAMQFLSSMEMVLLAIPRPLDHPLELVHNDGLHAWTA